MALEAQGDKKKILVGPDDLRELDFNEIIKMYTSKVIFIIKPWLNRYDYEDLKQIGMLALWKAFVNYKFDDRNIGFGYYANLLIRNEIMNFHKKNIRHNVDTESLDIPINEKGTEFVDIIENPMDLIEESLNLIWLKDILNGLKEDEKRLINYRLMGLEQKDIGNIFGVGQPVISRRLSKIKNKIEITRWIDELTISC